MAADLEPSDTSTAVHPTERQRALRAALLGAVLGVTLALLSRRRSARRDPGQSR